MKKIVTKTLEFEIENGIFYYNLSKNEKELLLNESYQPLFFLETNVQLIDIDDLPIFFTCNTYEKIFNSDKYLLELYKVTSFDFINRTIKLEKIEEASSKEVASLTLKILNNLKNQTKIKQDIHLKHIFMFLNELLTKAKTKAKAKAKPKSIIPELKKDIETLNQKKEKLNNENEELYSTLTMLEIEKLIFLQYAEETILNFQEDYTLWYINNAIVH